MSDDPDQFAGLVATTYPATAVRTGSTWTVTVHELPEGRAARAQGTTWAEAEINAHDIVVDLLDAHPATVIVSVAPEDPEAAAAVRALTDARIARAEAEQAERDAARAAARTLTSRGWSTRDAGR
ncbi:hypothetical protein ACFV5N_11110, partial [Streptomyces sp. NPDC059853]|uniref:hypothetical protein n=1 Tax=Streptomyces sp. NPDC059853 TaxID=3346973 RepID=UPI00365E8568